MKKQGKKKKKKAERSKNGKTMAKQQNQRSFDWNKICKQWQCKL